MYVVVQQEEYLNRMAVSVLPFEQFKQLNVQELYEQCCSMGREDVGETLKKEKLDGCYVLQITESDIDSIFDSLGAKIFIRNLLSHYRHEARPVALSTVSYICKL